MKIYKQILAVSIISLILIVFWLNKNTVSQQPITQDILIENPRFCEIDSECAIRNTNCAGCSQNLTCLNAEIESCEYDNVENGIQCEPPTPRPLPNGLTDGRVIPKDGS